MQLIKKFRAAGEIERLRKRTVFYYRLLLRTPEKRLFNHYKFCYYKAKMDLSNLISAVKI
ncbi:MAG: hypothetical protein GTN53_22915 [Candidatus Aminicenantes bacterium]|nr:hypothetical protein [Candidatus Aminicenantes bacterium]NIQ69356.1 hypothetical protein [Candidatus Aminicenantes bacterium]NIT25357.1 hypothetical protein [Candidatus Aminicenantes bacterium]